MKKQLGMIAVAALLITGCAKVTIFFWNFR